MMLLSGAIIAARYCYAIRALVDTELMPARVIAATLMLTLIRRCHTRVAGAAAALALPRVRYYAAILLLQRY